MKVLINSLHPLVISSLLIIIILITTMGAGIAQSV
jgi:hypothetical protein